TGYCQAQMTSTTPPLSLPSRTAHASARTDAGDPSTPTTMRRDSCPVMSPPPHLRHSQHTLALGVPPGPDCPGSRDFGPGQGGEFATPQRDLLLWESLVRPRSL